MIKLLENLINIPSVSGDEAEIGRCLLRHLQEKGYAVQQQPVFGDAFNILAMPGKSAKVLLCSHIDTVAPFIPFRRDGDVIRGRGACDAKGQIVAMISAADRLVASGITDFGLLFVVDEETSSRGAKKAVELDVDSRYVIVGEPTDNKLAVGQKGVLMFHLTATGTGGHSSLPERGESAVHKLVALCAQWLNMDWGEDELLGRSSVNIGVFNGGVGMNVLAPEAKASGIFRVAASLAEIHRRIDATLPPDIELHIPSESEPQRMLSLPGFETQVVGFGTDAAHLRPLGDIILYGPGSICFAHRDDEQISIGELHKAVDDYATIVRLLLQGKVNHTQSV